MLIVSGLLDHRPERGVLAEEGDLDAGREELAGEEAEVVVEVVVFTAQAEDEPPLPQIRLAGGGIDEHEKIHRDGDGRAVAQAADAVSERGTRSGRPSFTPAAAVCSR